MTLEMGGVPITYDPDDAVSTWNYVAEIASMLHNARFKWEEVKLLHQLNDQDGMQTDMFTSWALYSLAADELLKDIDVQVRTIEEAWFCIDTHTPFCECDMVCQHIRHDIREVINWDERP